LSESVVKVESVLGFRRAASQVALKREATAPTAFGASVEEDEAQV
jgi:hypothetical protein